MEIVHLLRIASLFIPVTHECLGSKLTVEIRGLLDNKILIHVGSYNINNKNTSINTSLNELEINLNRSKKNARVPKRCHL